MVDTKTPGDKTLSVPTKTLTLKPRVEQGTVRQSFSHGRTKQVVVAKRGKRRLGGDGPATEAPHAPEPIVAKPAAPVAKAPMSRPAPPPWQPQAPAHGHRLPGHRPRHDACRAFPPRPAWSGRG